MKIHNHSASTKEKQKFFFDTFRPIADKVYVENLVSMWPEVDPAASNMGLDNGYRFGGDITERNVCAQIFKSMLINANGEVVPCCVDFKRINKIGNVQINSVKNIWNSDPLNELRYKHLTGNKCNLSPCKDCTMNDVGDPDNIDPYVDTILNNFLQNYSPIDRKTASELVS